MVLLRCLPRRARLAASPLPPPPPPLWIAPGRSRGLMAVAPSPLTKFLNVSEEVRAAISARKPVVALESAIYTHGFPYPENVELAQDVEGQVRKHGAVPATICVLDGVCRVGLDSNELVRLAGAAGKNDTLKVSRRDIPYLTGLKLAGQSFNGGTTIAATMILAELAGIGVFATGGLGGVHRGAENTMDISTDLTELGRTNVAVICSGSKAFLDLGKTLEYLETQGVLVCTFGKRGEKVEFPAFYSRGSGILSPNVVETPKEAASIIHASRTLGLSSGQLFCNPIPAEHEIPSSKISAIIAEAVEKARKEGATGKDNTPYILSRIREKSKGRSVAANKALVMDNARVGAQVAVELVRLQGVYMRPDSTKGDFIPSLPTTTTETPAPFTLSTPKTQPLEPTPSNAFGSGADLLIIGSIAVDYTCTYTPASASASSIPSLSTSNPTSIVETTGGVANNVYTAAQLYLHGLSTSQSPAAPSASPKVRLISTLASDLTGKSILSTLQSRGVDTSGVYIRNPAEGGGATARYIALNDADGGLFTATADMRIVEEIPLSHIRQQIERARPNWVCADGNMSPEGIAEVLQSSGKVGAKVVFEPTSVQKSTRLFYRCDHDHSGAEVGIGSSRSGSDSDSDSSTTVLGLGVYPHHNVHIATPNIYELKAMWKRAREAEYFESMEWFHVVDSMNIDTMFRNSIEHLSQKLLHHPNLLSTGLVQQAIHLLPYIPNLFITLGSKGVLALSILPPNGVNPPAYPPPPSSTSSSPYSSITTVSRPGSTISGGLCVQYFPPAELVPREEIVSVNGVGDTFVGVLLARIVELETEAASGTAEVLRWGSGQGRGRGRGGWVEDAVALGQRAAVATLRSREAVGAGVASLRT